MKTDVDMAACLFSAITTIGTHQMQWASNARKSPNVPATIIRSFVPYIPLSQATIVKPKGTPGAIAKSSQHITLSNETLTRWCDEIFDHGFETVAKLSLGKHGCPYLYAR
jgi:hypothetical protein